METAFVFTEFNIMTALSVVIAYILGSISPAIIAGRLHGVDIRKEGSGNAGTTNVLRVLGGKAAIVTLACDIGKGAIAVLIGAVLDGSMAAYLAAIGVFLGHIFPVFYGFKGGKGVATAFGAVLAVDWRVALLCLLLVIIVTLITGRMSAGSLCGAAALPIMSALLKPEFTAFGAIIGIIIIIKHRSNIKRLLKGEEPKLGFLSGKGKAK